MVGADVVSTPQPLISYSDSTLKSLTPSARVLWAAGNVSIRVDPAASQLLDVLVIPVCNAVGATIALVTDAGANITIPSPVALGPYMSATLAVDLRVLEPVDAKRTSGNTDGFALNFSGLSAPLILGGAIMVYGPARPLVNYGYQWGFKKNPRGASSLLYSESDVQYLTARRTMLRSYDLSAFASAADRTIVDEWSEANFIGALPSFTWMTPSVRNVPIFGIVKDFSITEDSGGANSDAAILIGIKFEELNKGKPIF